MSDNGGLAVYMMYHALRLHFISDSYDYFKYNGKTNTSKDSFLTNKNKYSFYKLSRNYSLHECKDFLVANFLVGDIKWVGELLTEESVDNYRRWQKRNQSLSYQFENDLSIIFDKHEPAELLKVKPGEFPKLLQYAMDGTISVETLAIMNDLMNFFPMWEKKIDDDIIWPTWQRKIKKYTPFVVYDKMKFTQLIRKFL